MSPEELRQRFPKGSEDFIRRNSTPAPNLNRVVAAGATKKRLRQKSGDGLNSTERAFGEYLRSTMPEHRHFAQSVTLLLANGVRYTPDYFSYSKCTGFAIAHEVKGFMRDDAAVKIKVAASVYPEIEFRLVTKAKKTAGGGWSIQKILP